MGLKRKFHEIWQILLLSLALTEFSHAQEAANRLVEIESIQVTGTHLPSTSISRLSGLKVHDKVNDKIVNDACHKITATGLVKKIDYAYDAYPDRPSVVLNLILADEDPLLPAVIKPSAQEDALWSSLQALDPIFRRELPPTEKALAFYAKYLEKCLQASGRPNEYAAPNVTADASGKLTGIIFEVRQYKTLPTSK